MQEKITKIKSFNIKSLLPSIVYGGSDGAVSYFSLIAGAYGAGLSPKVIIAIGLSNLVADGFSMASADYLSEESRSEVKKNISLYSAILTFLSFIIIGALPMLPSFYSYFFSNAGPESVTSKSIFLTSGILTLFAFAFIGYMRAKVLNKNKTKSIIQSVLICSLSAAVAYFIGEYISKII
jgi:VIT1/CCC1 family predicted Fe2+/Mn2+ transporter